MNARSVARDRARRSLGCPWLVSYGVDVTERPSAEPRASAPTGTPLSEFTLEVVALPADIDVNLHVSNLVYLRWVVDAAVAHSIAAGWDQARYVEEGATFLVRRHEIDYLASALEGDRVQIVTHVESWTAATSRRVTRIERDGKVLARAVTIWAFVAFDGRPRRIPAPIREAFLGALHSPLPGR